MVSPLIGTTPPDQLPAVFQALLTAPVQVSAIGAGPGLPPAAMVTGTPPVVSTPAWFQIS